MFRARETEVSTARVPALTLLSKVAPNWECMRSQSYNQSFDMTSRSKELLELLSERNDRSVNVSVWHFDTILSVLSL